MLRCAHLLITLLPLSGLAQDVAVSDTTRKPEPEWNTRNYTQERKIFNALTLSPVQNPALAGFDRQLAVSYGWQANNTAYHAPVREATEPGFWQQTAMLDFAFAGKRKNMGVAVMYQGGREWKSTYHKVMMAHSYRFNIGKHALIFGLGGGLRWTDPSGDRIYSDMIDPRMGVLYSTQDRGAPSGNRTPIVNTGVIYTWQRLVFSFALTNQNGAYWDYAWVPDNRTYHDLLLAYHFRIPMDLTLSPSLRTVYDHGNVTRPNQFWFPEIRLTYKDAISMSIGTPNLDRLQLDVAVQLWDAFRLSATVAPYFLKKSHDSNGLAVAGGSIRYLIPIWKP